MSDREKYIKQYGDNFFENTKPVLIIHNNTTNYSFEIEINDFANCWYFNINDEKCDYSVELGRRSKENAQFHKDNESNPNKKDILSQKNKNNPPMPLEPRPRRSGLSNNEGQNDDNRQDRQPSMLDFKRENSNSFFGSRYLDLSREGSRNNSFFFNFDGELNKFNSKPNM